MRRLAFKYYFFIYESKYLIPITEREKERKWEKNYNIKQTFYFYFTEKRNKNLANKIFIITFYTFQIVKI